MCRVGGRIGIDPWPARLLFVLILLIVPGTHILLLYPVLWILMPDEAPTGAGIPMTPESGMPSAA
jgi:phage shock protein C